MPALIVSLDAQVRAVVQCDINGTVSVRLAGSRVEETFAALDMSGGTYPDSGESTYLTWIHDLELKPGQEVRIAFENGQSTSHPGKTIEELFPNEPPAPAGGPNDLAAMFEEIRQSALVWPRFTFDIILPDGSSYSGQTTTEEHGFALSVLWNWVRPERVSVSLTSFTIDNVERRESGREHVRTHLQVGQFVLARIGA